MTYTFKDPRAEAESGRLSIHRAMEYINRWYPTAKQNRQADCTRLSEAFLKAVKLIMASDVVRVHTYDTKRVVAIQSFSVISGEISDNVSEEMAKVHAIYEGLQAYPFSCVYLGDRTNDLEMPFYSNPDHVTIASICALLAYKIRYDEGDTSGGNPFNAPLLREAGVEALFHTYVSDCLTGIKSTNRPKHALTTHEAWVEYIEMQPEAGVTFSLTHIDRDGDIVMSIKPITFTDDEISLAEVAKAFARKIEHFYERDLANAARDEGECDA